MSSNAWLCDNWMPLTFRYPYMTGYSFSGSVRNHSILTGTIIASSRAFLAGFSGWSSPAALRFNASKFIPSSIWSNVRIKSFRCPSLRSSISSSVRRRAFLCLSVSANSRIGCPFARNRRWTSSCEILNVSFSSPYWPRGSVWQFDVFYCSHIGIAYIFLYCIAIWCRRTVSFLFSQFPLFQQFQFSNLNSIAVKASNQYIRLCSFVSSLIVPVMMKVSLEVVEMQSLSGTSNQPLSSFSLVLALQDTPSLLVVLILLD